MKKILKVCLIGIMIILPSAIILAATGGDSSIHNPIGPDSMDLNALVVEILKVISMVGGIVCVFYIIYAGFLFVTAQGNPDAIGKAKTTLLWSVIGAAVLLGAFVIAEVIKGTVEGVTNIKLPR